MARNIVRISALGALGFLASCGDPVPPAAQGAISVRVEETSDATEKCPPGLHWANAPHDSSSLVQFQRVQASETGSKAVNGQDGNSVSCSVVPSGSKFVFKGQINSAAAKNGRPINPTNIQMSIPGGIAPGDSSALGSLRVQDDASLSSYFDQNCLYSVLPQKEGEGLGVDKGRIWGSVACKKLADPLTPGAVCLVSTGFFIFENCTE